MVGRIGIVYGELVPLLVALIIVGSLPLCLGTSDASYNQSMLLRNGEILPLEPESAGYNEPADLPLPMLTGNPLWDNVYTLTDGSYGRVVIPLDDGGYALFGDAYTSDKGYEFGMVRINATGQPVVAAHYGGSEPEHLYDAIEASTGDFVMVGETFSFGSGMYDIWVLCVDENGNHVWNSTIGTGMYDSGRAIIEVSTGGFLVLAELEPVYGGGDVRPRLIRLDELGSEVWYQTYDLSDDSYVFVRDLIECDDGGFAFVGRILYDSWLFRVDSLGNQLWNRTYESGYSSSEWFSSIVRQDHSGFILAGATNGIGAGLFDVWMVWTDTEGNLIYDQAYGGPTSEWCERAIEIEYGGIALTGEYRHPGPGGSDGTLFMRIDFNGILLLNQHYGEGGGDYGFGIGEMQHGGVVVLSTDRNATGQVHFSLRAMPEVKWLENTHDVFLDVTDSLYYALSADSAAGISQWVIDDASRFAISNAGVITNLLPFEVGIFPTQVTVEDTFGNSVTTGIWMWVDDNSAPQWVESPVDQAMELGHEFVYDLNATDPSGPLKWSIDNDTRFTIDSGGIVRSVGMLSVGPYSVPVSVRDVYGNTLSTIIVVTVRDTTAPTWTSAPANQFLLYGEPVQCQFAASDLSGVTNWKVSDTAHFAISPTGLLTSEGILESGTYPLVVTVADTCGNEASASLTVYIDSTGYTTTTTSTTTTMVGQADWGTLLAAGGIGFAAGVLILSLVFLCLRSRRKDE